MGSLRKKHLVEMLDSTWLGGDVGLAATYGTSANIKILLLDYNSDIMLATGTDVPSDATSGYAKGCLFIDRDVATGTTGLYINKGTNTSCNFDAHDVPGADSITSAAIADDAVSKEHLDSGIDAAYITVYAGDFSWTGSGAAQSGAVSGVLSGDTCVATIKTAPSQAAYIKSVAPSANKLTFTLSAANTSNDAVISYIVQRATS